MKKKTIPISLRRQVIKRDDFTCQKCGKRAKIVVSNGAGILNIYMKEPPYVSPRKWSWYDPEPFEIDHIIPEFEGGETTIENLQLLCRSCNRSKWIKN